MNKWTGPALFALVALLGGGYWLLAKPPKDSAGNVAAPDGELSVEEFEEESDAGNGAYETPEGSAPPEGTPAPRAKRSDRPAADGTDTSGRTSVPTIDDDEGETIEPPVMLEDNDEESFDASQPGAARVRPQP